MVILAAGVGTRLWPFTDAIPKVMMPVGGKPCIRWIVDHLLDSTTDAKITIACLESDLAMFKHEFRDILKLVEFETSKGPRGTAGQLAFLNEDCGKDFAVWYGDNLINLSLQDLYEEHTKARAAATLAVTKKVELDYGVVITGDPREKVVAFLEKPWMDQKLWAGVAVLNYQQVGYWLKEGRDLARDVFPALLAEGKRVQAIEFANEWYDIGNIPAYRRVNDLAKEGKLFA